MFIVRSRIYVRSGFLTFLSEIWAVDGLVYAVWDVCCYFLGLWFLKLITAGRFKKENKEVLISFVGLLVFICVVVFLSVCGVGIRGFILFFSSY